MTIAIAANTAEGVVLGADSAVTYTSGGQPHTVDQIYDGAQKIYHLGLAEDCSDSPYAMMFWGAGSFAGVSWRNIVANFCRASDITAFPSAADVVAGLVDLLRQKEPVEANRPKGGILLAGFGENDTAVKCFTIDVRLLQTAEVGPAICFAGIAHLTQHLLWGIDDRTKLAIEQKLGGATIDIAAPDGTITAQPLADVVIDTIKEFAPTFSQDLDMPLRDAIDYVHFLVYATIKHQKFCHGAPVCGGDVEIAAITLDRGFRRIRRKGLDAFLP